MSPFVKIQKKTYRGPVSCSAKTSGSTKVPTPSESAVASVEKQKKNVC